MKKISPMMAQYWEIKEKYKNHILFFRVGDFYEMFFDDAEMVSREIGLTLTGKDCGLKERAPMCGVPHHACETYIAKLISRGHKVAICEQVENPAQAKGIVKRDVIRIITPGTVSDSSMLPDEGNNFLCCIHRSESAACICFADISTGEMYLTSFTEDLDQNLCNEMDKFSPSEVLMNDVAVRNRILKEFVENRLQSIITRIDPLDVDDMPQAICMQFGADRLEDIGLSAECDEQIECLFDLLYYIEQTQKTDISYLNQLDVYQAKQYMNLDITARRHLELHETMRSRTKDGSLFSVLNSTKSAMGARLLRSWLDRPLVSVVEINKRQDAIEALNQNVIARTDLQGVLDQTYDLERLMTKVVYNSANAKDMLALKNTFALLPKLKSILASVTNSNRIRKIYTSIDEMKDIYDLLDASIVDKPPITLREGGIIKIGYNEAIDELREMVDNSTAVIRRMEESEKEKTGIKNMKVGYNRVFGYYIEVSKSNLDLVPDTYIRRQTLVDRERFVTEELKVLENKILSAKEQDIALEYDVFTDIRNQVFVAYSRVQKTASALAELDVYCSLSQTAQKHNYVRPTVSDRDGIHIVGGRHPVVEHHLKNTLFVPNDTDLDSVKERIMLITGPNMGGKSTYMRQVALITLLAQIGSFVPAERAEIGVVDKIFTRVGASDDLAAGQSTFMVEMTEVAYILKNASKKSLMIFDEIGRGTATFDGMSIARAVIEYIVAHKKIGGTVLFATHYHELCALEGVLEGVVNYNVAVKKRGDDVVFLRKIVRGGADDSYGIEVAALAGMPKEIVYRAKEILESLSSEPSVRASSSSVQTDEVQMSLGDFCAEEIKERLRSMDVSTITPIEAIGILYELSDKAKKEG